MKRRGFLFAACCFFALEANAAGPTIKDTIKASAAPEVKTLIGAHLRAFGAANDYSAIVNKKAFYCMPPKLALTTEQANDIFARYIASYPDFEQRPAEDMAILLLMSLVDAFPCP